MKKREGGDKLMGQPMFPRLHVNDTEKGGPRAPPRNKMALYEQLTITSQTARNQRIDRERRLNLPQHEPPVPPSYPHNELRGTKLVNSSNQPPQIEHQRTKPVEEDDLMVPVFSRQRVAQFAGSTQNSGDEERRTNNGTKMANKESRSLRVSDVANRYSETTMKNNGEGDSDPPEREYVDRDDVMSETSILDSTSALEISSEDVVRMIGAKNFWKARNAIANHQRMLAAQVFELHRLMKVQGLVAGDPNLLLEEAAFIGATRLKEDSNVKKCSNNVKKKDDPKNPSEKLDFPAENAVSYIPSTTVSAPAESSPPINTDPKMNPWSFQQPQWLVPVMCPSQGLVYKPCSTPGFTGPPFGAHGPPLMNPTPYGAVQMGYFHPYGYGMPVIMGPSGSGPLNVTGRMNSLSSQGDTHGQSNGPIQENNTTTMARPEDRLTNNRGSTRELGLIEKSSGVIRVVPRGRGSTRELELTEKSSGVIRVVPRGRGSTRELELTEKSSGVIRVVPRDRGSTRESAARIFQSIQEERRQQGSD